MYIYMVFSSAIPCCPLKLDPNAHTHPASVTTSECEPPASPRERQYLYFCTSKASKPSTCTHVHYALVLEAGNDLRSRHKVRHVVVDAQLSTLLLAPAKTNEKSGRKKKFFIENPADVCLCLCLSFHTYIRTTL